MDVIKKIQKRKDSIPQFILKLHQMIETPIVSNILLWSKSGKSFEIINKQGLCSQLLPQYFKHANYSSFLKQLNIYGFKKTKNDLGQSEFSNKYFLRGQKHLLFELRRKKKPDLSEYRSKNNSGEQQTVGAYQQNMLDDLIEMKQQIKLFGQQQIEIYKESQILVEQNELLLKQYQDFNEILNSHKTWQDSKFQTANRILFILTQLQTTKFSFSSRFMNFYISLIYQLIQELSMEDKIFDDFNSSPGLINYSRQSSYMVQPIDFMRSIYQNSPNPFMLERKESND